MTLCNSCQFEVEEIDVTCDGCQKPVHDFCLIDGICDVCFMTKSEEKPVIDLPDFVRRTHIETYRSCPYKFKKEVLEGHDMPPTCYTLIGQDLHDLFEKGLLDRNYSISDMQKEWAPIWSAYPDTLFDSDEQKSKMELRATTSIENFFDIRERYGAPFVTEETIFFDVGEGLPKVRFTMDAIFETESGLELIDWKTGAVMTGKKLSSDLQAPLYIYGVMQHYDKHVERFTFYYLNESKERVYEYVGQKRYRCMVGKREYFIDLDEMLTEVRNVFNKMKKNQFSVPSGKGMYFTCKMCHIREKGLCAGAELQAWHNKGE